ncbi:MAG: response regulator [Bacteroidia bacterium]
MNILIIEDNPGDIMLARKAINNHAKKSLQVMDVDNGKDAIAFISKTNGYENVFTPDLIFLDWTIPIIHGSEVLYFIKSQPEYSLIPVIVFTTSGRESDMVQSYLWHANAYIKKPDDYWKLDEMMGNIIRFWSMISRPGTQHIKAYIAEQQSQTVNLH